MTARYIVRLDDACDTSDLNKWGRIESLLDDAGIKPIVAVIPDNQDKTLLYMDYNPDFWGMIRRWESKGWTIAMHGYQHQFHPVDRHTLLYPMYNRSEFGGLSLEKQREKISASLTIFKSNAVQPSMWVAPAHSFDEITLDALSLEVDFKTVSDGFALSPYKYKGFDFLPQQLWGFKKRLVGTWTICCHPDTMNEADFMEFQKGLKSKFFKNKFISTKQVIFREGDRNLIDRLYSFYFWFKYELKMILK